jgi:flagellar biosynthesis protein FliQ
VSALDRWNMGDRALMPAIAIGVIAIAFCAMTLILEYGLAPVPTIIVALVIETLVVWLSRGVTAKTLAECWPETELSDG